jgi:hypothetical protein
VENLSFQNFCTYVNTGEKENSASVSIDALREKGVGRGFFFEIFFSDFFCACGGRA